MFEGFLGSALALTVLAGANAQADASPHTEQFVRVNGISLDYLDWGGRGDGLVFLTGYGAQAHVLINLRRNSAHHSESSH